MLRITVTKDGGLPQVSTFDKREITIGRVKTNDLVIGEPGVSSAHARILSTGDGLTLIDLESTNGTFVNGERIRGPALVQPGDEVYICAYRLDFELMGSGPQPMAGPARIGQPAPASPIGPPMAPPMGPALDGPPPLLGGPEYPTPAELGPPPLMRMPSAPEPPSFEGPPLLDEPPPLAPPSPIGPPMAAMELEEAYDAPPLLTPPVLEAPPPIRPEELEPPPPMAPPPMAPPPMAPPPMAPPPMAPPPPITAPPLQPEPERPSAMVSGSFSEPENAPPSGPPEPSDLPPPILRGRTQMGTAPEPMPMALVSSMAAASSVPPPIDPTPTPLPAPLAPVRAVAAPAPQPFLPAPSDDLSDLKGPGAGVEACARVFAVVWYRLAPDGSLPARDAQTRARARSEAQRLLSEVAERVPEVQARPWANRLANELCGLGALSVPLAEPDVLDVYVHGPERVLVRRQGEPAVPIDATFSCPAAVEVVVRRLTGRPFGPEQPWVDARASDGADVRAVHGSLTSPGPLVTIHRAAPHGAARGLESLVQARAIPSGMATLLHHCMQAGLNLLVCGGPGARTFEWLAALAAEAPEHDRQIVVRPGPEPDPLPSNAVVVHSGSLAPRDGLSGPQQAVRGALALGPDRLVVHEVAGSEASEVVAAMGRGLSGMIVSVRAGSADAGLARLTALVGLAGDAPDAAARARHVAGSVDLVLAVSRFADGHVRVTQLAEATVSSAGTAQAVDLVTYQPHTGRWVPTGVAPTVLIQMEQRGISVDADLLGE
jgi:pilus assembly protein CpaF